MQLSDSENRQIEIWEQMRTIEGEIFLLSARSGEVEPENHLRIKILRCERTHLAGQLLLNKLG